MKNKKAYLMFKLNGKELCGYTLVDEGEYERQATLELLAYENNCNIEDIKLEVKIKGDV